MSPKGRDGLMNPRTPQTGRLNQQGKLVKLLVPKMNMSTREKRANLTQSSKRMTAAAS